MPEIPSYDFTGPGAIYYADLGGIGDVGLPANAPAGTISGWDMAGVYLEYDAFTDPMYVGIDCGGAAGPSVICGDADGNAEVAVGVNDSTSISSFAAYSRLAGTGFAFPPLTLFWQGQLLNAVSYYASPSAGAPDVEFSIAGFSSLPNFGFSPGKEFCFDTLIYAGSQEDDGVGEDSIGPTKLCLNGTTAVDLVSFMATAEWRSIDLAWETASETDNLGFNLYRAEFSTGPWTQLNEELIPGQAPGVSMGGAYTFTDNAVRRGVTYYYRLEDVSLTSSSAFHGPISAKLQSLRIDPLRPRLKPAPAGTTH